MFSKNPEPKPRGAPAVAKAEPGFSILGADLTLRGGVTAVTDLHVDGTIEGDVTCRALVQGEASTITGSISADSVRLAGTVEGPIDAAQVVRVRAERLEERIACRHRLVVACDTDAGTRVQVAEIRTRHHFRCGHAYEEVDS